MGTQGQGCRVQNAAEIPDVRLVKAREIHAALPLPQRCPGRSKPQCVGGSVATLKKVQKCNSELTLGPRWFFLEEEGGNEEGYCCGCVTHVVPCLRAGAPVPTPPLPRDSQLLPASLSQGSGCACSS